MEHCIYCTRVIVSRGTLHARAMLFHVEHFQSRGAGGAAPDMIPAEMQAEEQAGYCVRIVSRGTFETLAALFHVKHLKHSPHCFTWNI